MRYELGGRSEGWPPPGESGVAARATVGAGHLSQVLRLSLGDPARPPRDEVEWRLTFEVARRERCAALAWARSGHLIRALAPASLVDEWRATVLSQYEYATRLLTIGSEVLTTLEERRIEAILVKGAPLSERLYHDPLVRPMDDLDVVIAPSQWEQAARILRESGWRKECGRAGWSEIYHLVRDEQTYRLDLQSSAFVDHLAHLPVPSATLGHWRWGHATFRTYVGPEVAVFLAVHLLKHQLPPVLWLVDLFTLWSGMSEVDRLRARRMAREARAHRYLQWAIARSSGIVAAAAGDEEAMRALGFEPGLRRDTYGMLRLAGLAGSPRDALAVLAAWAWPRPMRYDWTAFGAMWRRRVGKSVWGVLSARRTYLERRDRSDPTPIRSRGATGRRPTEDDRAHAPDQVDEATGAVAHSEPPARGSLFLAGEVTARGSTWVQARGHSMAPTLRHGDRVLLRPAPAVDVRRGDIIALAVSRQTVLHRVVGVSGDGRVWTRGDNMLADDRPAPSGDVVGIAVVADRGGTLVALRPTLEFGVVACVRGIHARARLQLARTWRGARAKLLIRSGVAT